ncbi:class I SAM-dependent methyltransferase [Streptomyces nondiastaticus]|uniref:Class I SAM-dependent methyltransferase n=1 Tax=Streptomyces nondiastaticus TaxID=3154512 RepID=A0ABW6TRU2_9ACTN
MRDGDRGRKVEPCATHTEGSVLASQYESVTFEEIHRHVLHLIPTGPLTVLDIGAGTGRDAAALSVRGHTVVAVEPAEDLRAVGQRIHAAHDIHWVNDTLPDLKSLCCQHKRFQLVMLTAVWMFLREDQRRCAASRIDELLEEGGRLGMVIRSGPAPADRGMYTVSAAETISLLATSGIRLIHQSQQADALGRGGVAWNNLFFEKSSAPERTADASPAVQLQAGRAIHGRPAVVSVEH